MKECFTRLPKNKRQRILDAAFLEFSRYGYHQASTNRLVRQLSISKGSLYNYFDSKLDLYNDLLTIALKKLLSHMSTFQTNHSSPINRLLDYAVHEYNFLIKYPLFYHFFYQLQKELDHPDLATIKKQLNRQALELSHQLFDRLAITDNPLFRQHLLFIILGYNQHFLASLTLDTDWHAQKKAFLDGLKSHLELIAWTDCPSC